MRQTEEATTIHVRQARREESPIILELWQSSARWLQSKGIHQWEPEYFSLEQAIEWFDSGAEVYVAESNNEIVGTIIINWSDSFMWEELDDRESGYIHRFATSRNHIGMKIGGQLLDWAESYIRASGRKIRLDCMAANERLNDYYRSREYKWIRTKEWNNWRANLYEKE